MSTKRGRKEGTKALDVANLGDEFLLVVRFAELFAVLGAIFRKYDNRS
jgi:hypothetical protein